jgi:hypothetical protein
MRTGIAIVAFSVVAFAQSTTFEIASVKASPRPVGPDYNNQLTISPSQLIGKSARRRAAHHQLKRIRRGESAGPHPMAEFHFTEGCANLPI